MSPTRRGERPAIAAPPAGPCARQRTAGPRRLQIGQFLIGCAGLEPSWVVRNPKWTPASLKPGRPHQPDREFAPHRSPFAHRAGYAPCRTMQTSRPCSCTHLLCARARQSPEPLCAIPNQQMARIAGTPCRPPNRADIASSPSRNSRTPRATSPTQMRARRQAAMGRKRKSPASPKTCGALSPPIGGDGGIRTLDPGFGPDAPLAGECLRPLGHVSQTFARTREVVRRSQDNIGF